MQYELWPKKIKLVQCDIKVRTRGDLTAILWRDKRDSYMFLELASVKGNFCIAQWKAMKLLIMEHYDCHMHYMVKGDRMASSFSMSCCTWKWMRKLPFHLLGSIFWKVTFFFFHVMIRTFHRDFLCARISNMLAQPGQQLQVQRPLGRPAGTASNIGRLNISSSKQWFVTFKQLHCRVPSTKGVMWKATKVP